MNHLFGRLSVRTSFTRCMWEDLHPLVNIVIWERNKNKDSGQIPFAWIQTSFHKGKLQGVFLLFVVGPWCLWFMNRNYSTILWFLSYCVVRSISAWNLAWFNGLTLDCAARKPRAIFPWTSQSSRPEKSRQSTKGFVINLQPLPLPSLLIPLFTSP